MSVEDGFDMCDLEKVNRQIVDLISRKFPKEAKALMNKQASAFREKLKAQYAAETKKHTGNLLKGVKKSSAYVYSSEYQARVRNTAPHAQLIEHGHAEWIPQKQPGGDYKAEETEKWVEGRHVAAHAMEAYQRTFEEDVDRFVDEILQESFE